MGDIESLPRRPRHCNNNKTGREDLHDCQFVIFKFFFHLNSFFVVEHFNTTVKSYLTVYNSDVHHAGIELKM